MSKLFDFLFGFFILVCFLSVVVHYWQILLISLIIIAIIIISNHVYKKHTNNTSNSESRITPLLDESSTSSQSIEDTMNTMSNDQPSAASDHPLNTTDSLSSNENTVNLNSFSKKEIDFYISGILATLGYTGIHITRQLTNQAVDITAKKAEKLIAIKYISDSKTIDEQVIRTLFTNDYVNYDNHILITNGAFTNNVITLSQKLGIELWDLTKLSEPHSPMKTSHQTEIYPVPQNNSIEIVSESISSINVLPAPPTKPFSISAGLHFVGKDITPGRYRVTTPVGSGNFFGDDINIILSHQPKTNNGEVGSYTADFAASQRVKVSGIASVLFEPIIDRHYHHRLSPGKWVVGLDIAPGYYSIVASQGSGNVYSYAADINEVLSTNPTDYSEVPSVMAELLVGQEFSTDVPELLLISIQ